MNAPLDLVIHGASGRNGKRLIALGSADPQVRIVGALVRPNSSALGQDAGSFAGSTTVGHPSSTR
jgi:4-hydroxy-tetrahydrodipicolinate reductase